MNHGLTRGNRDPCINYAGALVSAFRYSGAMTPPPIPTPYVWRHPDRGSIWFWEGADTPLIASYGLGREEHPPPLETTAQAFLAACHSLTGLDWPPGAHITGAPEPLLSGAVAWQATP